MTAWALVPARGGSKSISYKNLVPLSGVPLLDYGVRAAQAAGSLQRIVCSTEDARIAQRAREIGIEVDDRPAELAGDETAVADVAREFLQRASARGPIPEILVLVQPTSPFLLPEHVDDLVAALAADEEARSAHNVVPCPHNHHAWNQRIVESGRARFVFEEERAAAYNKQRKPGYSVFGNLIAARSSALLEGDGFYAQPMVALEIRRPYDMDVDGPEDVGIASAMLSSGCIVLPHVERPADG